MGKSVIIIGAGLAGLSAGCYCQMNGYQTSIFEHHTLPGGVAAAWRRRDYLIDGGIHFLMGYRPGTAFHEVLRQLGVIPATRFIELTTYGRFIDEDRGRSLLVTSDLNRLAEELKALSPADAGVVEELVSGARAMQGLDLSEAGIGKPPELSGRLERLREAWKLRRLLRYFGGRYARPVSEFVREVKDPGLRNCLQHLFLPEVPVWFIFMLLGLLADGELGLIEGGCRDFVSALERRFCDLGGRICYQSTVERILVEGNRAVGVRLADGREHRCEAVVSAADGYSTIFQMLEGRYLSDRIKNRYNSWRLIWPMLMVSYGVAREFAGEPAFTTIMLKRPLMVNRRPVKMVFLRIFNYSNRFASPGHTVVQVEFETEWDFWNDLQRRDRAAYNNEKQRIAAEVLERLESHFPGLGRQVEVTDVATPYTTWRYTLNRQGAWEGWLPTPEVITTPVERTLPGLKDFYLAGQWVMPGGGVSPCIYSGRHVAQLLCHRDRKRFKVQFP